MCRFGVGPNVQAHVIKLPFLVLIHDQIEAFGKTLS